MDKFRKQYSQREFFPDDYEKGGGERITESAGYITAEQQIFSMVDAGRRLVDARKEMYDYEGEINDRVDMDAIPVDPTRSPGIDMGEISQMELRVKARLSAQSRGKEKVEIAVEEKKAELNSEVK